MNVGRRLPPDAASESCSNSRTKFGLARYSSAPESHVKPGQGVFSTSTRNTTTRAGRFRKSLGSRERYTAPCWPTRCASPSDPRRRPAARSGPRPAAAALDDAGDVGPELPHGKREPVVPGLYRRGLGSQNERRQRHDQDGAQGGAPSRRFPSGARTCQSGPHGLPPSPRGPSHASAPPHCEH